VQPLSTKIQLQWRRSKVLEYLSTGYSQVEIANRLQVDEPTISRDIYFLNKQAQDNLQKHIHETIPGEYQKAMVGMKRNLRRVLEIADSTTDSRLKLQASSIANECYRDIMDLCTNAGIVSDALKFVESKTEKLVRDSSPKHKEENSPGHNDNDEEETATDSDSDTEPDIEGVF
jgi:hypothetical protein